jgi:hypothetical protein
VHGTGGRKRNPLPVTITTANAHLEISSKQESAIDRETANAVTLYASRKEASCIKKMLGNSVRLHTVDLAPLRMGMREAHLDKSNREERMLLLSYHFGNHQ